MSDLPIWPQCEGDRLIQVTTKAGFLVGASLSELHIDHDNSPRVGNIVCESAVMIFDEEW